MKKHTIFRCFSILLALAMVLGIMPLTARAVNVWGAIAASKITANADLVLTADTTLNMDKDLCLSSIRGDYSLTVKGSGTLTVRNTGIAIDVKKLNAQSDLVLESANGDYAIRTTNDVHIDNNYLFVNGGIYSGAHAKISCTDGTIAGLRYGICSTQLNLSGTMAIGGGDQAVYAYAGFICMGGTFDFQNVDTSKYCVEAMTAVYTDTQVNLTVRGGGICSQMHYILLQGDTIDVVTEKGSAIAAQGGNVTLGADKLVAYGETGYGILAQGIVDIDAESATIYGQTNAVSSTKQDITLDGNFYIGSAGNTVYAAQGNIDLSGDFRLRSDAGNTILASTGAITVEGALDAQSKAQGYTVIGAAAGFRFDGSVLRIQGSSGIRSIDGDISITASEASLVCNDAHAICASYGGDSAEDNVYIDCCELWLENKLETENTSDKSGIFASGDVQIFSEDAVIIGDNAIECDNANLSGSFYLIGWTDSGIRSYENTTLQGQFTVDGETFGIHSDGWVEYCGICLRVGGSAGIFSSLYTGLYGGDISVTARGKDNSAIHSESVVFLEGNVTLRTSGSHGIHSAGRVALLEGNYRITGPKGTGQAILLDDQGAELYIEPSLKIFIPEGGKQIGCNLYDSEGNVARKVELRSTVDTLNIRVNPPVDGMTPAWDADGVYGLSPQCAVESVTWYEDGVKMDQNARFTQGKTYKVELIMIAGLHSSFSDDVAVRINDKQASVGMYAGNKKMVISRDLGTCPTAITDVSLTVTAPVEGNKPSTAVSAGNASYGVYSRNVRWMVSEDGDGYRAMGSTERFEGGKYYRVCMDVNTAGKTLAFRMDASADTIRPDVLATVNGNLARAEHTQGQEYGTVITVCFDFGKCNDFIIEEITIVDVVAPVAGAHPSYTANVLGTGYYIDTTRNAYEDVYWKNPPEKWYYLKNGMRWYDVTDGGLEDVYEHDVFLAGHQYVCYLYLKTESGYEFLMDLYTDPETWPTATVNGKEAEVADFGSNMMWNQQVSRTFTCTQNMVSTVKVKDIAPPVAGQQPDYTATVAEPELYSLDTGYGLNGSGIYWYDSEGRQLTEGETFRSGQSYRIGVKVVSTVGIGGGSLSSFADDVVFMINGRQIVPNGIWDEVRGDSDAVWGFCTFTMGTEGMEETVSLSGSVTSYLDDYAPITLELIGQGTTETAYEKTVSGNQTDYRFRNVPPGTYTLRIRKENHVTRAYTVTLGDADKVQDVKICLRGDVTGDGKLNMGDVSRAFAHVRGKNRMTDDYAIACADATSDGRLNLGDIARIFAHVRGKNKLF